MTAAQLICVAHDWRLIEVEFEDGRTHRVYACTACEQERLED